MPSFRERFALTFTAVLLISNLLRAAPALTTIQDVLLKADGTRFSGILQITWTSFQAGDTSNIPAQSVTTQVNNGYLHVLLVPTTNAATSAVYRVVYNSDGAVQFTEIWVVPPSTSPLRVSDVRSSSTTGSAAGLFQTQITDVSGLRTELNIRPTMGLGYSPSRAAVIDGNGGLAGATGNLSDCVHVDGISGPCGSSSGSSPAASFTDAEIPSGVVDGVNTTFHLAGAPSPALSLEIYRNGLALQRNVDFTVAGSTVTFQTSSVPQPGDVLQAFYRTGPGTTSSAAFADAETPSGAINGVNAVFGLANTPNPALSLEVFRNGLAMQRSVDFNVSGATITFLAGSVPQPGDVLEVFYRTAASGAGGSLNTAIPSCTVYTLNNAGGSWTVSANGGAAVAGPAMAAATAQDVPLFNLPSKGTITGIREKTTTAWGGAGFTTLSLWIGDSVGGPAFYTPPSYDLTALPANTNFLSTQLFKSATDAGSTVNAHVAANTLLNSGALSGSVDVDVCSVTLP